MSYSQPHNPIDAWDVADVVDDVVDADDTAAYDTATDVVDVLDTIATDVGLAALLMVAPHEEFGPEFSPHNFKSSKNIHHENPGVCMQLISCITKLKTIQL
jgi:hypothetical protein